MVKNYGEQRLEPNVCTEGLKHCDSKTFIEGQNSKGLKHPVTYRVTRLRAQHIPFIA